MPDVFDPAESEAPTTLAPHLARLTDDALTSGWDDCVTAVRQAEWNRTAFEAEIQRRRMWETDGTGSLRSWITTRSGEGDRSAFHHSTVARALPAYPQLSTAWRNGTVGFEHVRLLLTLARLTDLADGDLVTLGERHTVPQLDTLCRAARRLDRQRDDDAQRQRSVRWWVDDDGTVHLRGLLHGIDGLTVTNLLSAMATDDRPDPATGRYEPFDARCADALVELCSAPGSTPAERATVIIHAPLHALDPDAPDGVPAHWDGTVIGNHTLHRMLCDCRLRVALDDRAGRVIGIGRRSRTTPYWLADQVRWRDGGCRFPGCAHTRHLHNHHIRYWGLDGPTDLDNLALLCTRHHRLVHEGGWTLTGDPADELAFTSPTGSRHTSRAAPRPPYRRPQRRRPTPGRGRRRQPLTPPEPNGP
jgi:hypothetical protein